MADNWGKLERPANRIMLSRDLASGTHSHGQLAEKWGVARQSIGEFADRHAAEIAEIAADIQNELAGLWIADRKRMLAELQGDADMLQRLANAYEGSEGGEQAAGIPGVVRERRGNMDLAAKLAGLLREQVDVNVTRVVHEVVGVDPEELT